MLGMNVSFKVSSIPQCLKQNFLEPLWQMLIQSISLTLTSSLSNTCEEYYNSLHYILLQTV